MVGEIPTWSSKATLGCTPHEEKCCRLRYDRKAVSDVETLAGLTRITRKRTRRPCVCASDSMPRITQEPIP